MNDQDYWTIRAMEAEGGSFVKALAKAAMHADATNLAKIKAAWPEYWTEYESKGRKLKKSVRERD